MNDFRWLNQSQPQTLQFAVMLAYLNSVLALLDLNGLGPASGLGGPIIFIAIAGQAAGAVGVANEKKWGYALALVSVGVLAIARLLVVLRHGFNSTVLGLMFTAAVLGLLLHTQSREYRKIWFR